MRSGSTVEAASLELTFESGAVGLRGPASEVFYVVGGHSNMLLQASYSCAHRRLLREHTPPQARKSLAKAKKPGAITQWRRFFSA